MKKVIVLVAMMMLMSSYAFAGKVNHYKLTFVNLVAGTTENAPTTCQQMITGALSAVNCSSGMTITGSRNILAQLDTTDANNTATAVNDLNFLYNDDTTSYPCVNSLADNTKKSCPITSGPGTIKFTIDCATDVCRPIIWVDIEMEK